MLKKILLFLVLSLNVFALENIERTYYIDSREITSNLFFKDQKNIKLYEIPSHKHSLRIRREQLDSLLKENGFNDFEILSRYVYFELNSPIDTSKIETFLTKHYKSKYEKIKINKVFVKPRSFMDSLPSKYTLDIRTRNHLLNEGILSIEDNLNKKYFFNYKIDANVEVLTSTKKILRGEEITQRNSELKSIKLQKFRSIPLQNLYTSEFQAKYHIDKGEFISRRDVKKLDLVREDTQVTVLLNNAGIVISFVATALQSGKLNDIITIQKRDGRKLKARVVAKQRVEIK